MVWYYGIMIYDMGTCRTNIDLVTTVAKVVVLHV